VLVLSLAVRFLLPWLNLYLAQQEILPGLAPFALSTLYPLLISYMVLYQAPVLAGCVFGFLLLDEKDDKTLMALLVTPVPLWHYLLYRAVIAMLFGTLLTLAMALIIGQALVPPLSLLVFVLAAALTAPIVMLFFALVAENKVQGFAMTKFTGVAGALILVSWFLPAPWQHLVGLFPPFWISKAYWLALAGSSGWGWALLLGVGLQLALMSYLLWRFVKNLHAPT